MIDRRQGQPPRPGDRLGSGDADEQRADQPGARGHSNEVDAVEGRAGVAQGFLNDRRNELEVTA